jgi:hypothetical protein
MGMRITIGRRDLHLKEENRAVAMRIGARK